MTRNGKFERMLIAATITLYPSMAFASSEITLETTAVPQLFRTAQVVEF